MMLGRHFRLKRKNKVFIISFIFMVSPVGLDSGEIRRYGKIVKVCDHLLWVYLLLGKSSNLLWQFFFVMGKLSLL